MHASMDADHGCNGGRPCCTLAASHVYYEKRAARLELGQALREIRCPARGIYRRLHDINTQIGEKRRLGRC